MTEVFDTIIIGAGLSGLTTTKYLKDANISTLILEASDIPGGRLRSIENKDNSFEFGGTYIGHHYHRFQNLAKELNLTTIDVTPLISFFKKQDLVINKKLIHQDDWENHKENTLDKDLKSILPWNLHRIILEKYNPFDSPEACLTSGTKDQSMKDWLQSLGFDDQQIKYIYGMNLSYGTDADSISSLQLMHRASFSNRQKSESKVIGFTLLEGMNELANRYIDHFNLNILFNNRVNKIVKEKSLFSVSCENGNEFRAERIVLTCAPSTLKNITFDDHSKDQRIQFASELQSQPMFQIHFKHKKNFWEQDGFSPAIFSNEYLGMCYPVRNKIDPEEIIGFTAWVMGQKALDLIKLSQADACSVIINNLQEIRPSMRNAIELTHLNAWSHEKDFLGGWTYFKPNQFLKWHKLLQSEKSNIFFSGEHASISSRGIEGAIESGEKTANELLNSIH